MAKKSTSLAFLILKPLILLVLPFFIIANIVPMPNGQPMFNWASDAKNWFAQFQYTASEAVSHPLSISQPESVELYRWQDDKGLWHFSQQKPKSPIPFETMTVSTQLNNLMPKPTDTATLSTNSNHSSEAVTPLNVLQKAKDLHKTAEKRNQVLDSL